MSGSNEPTPTPAGAGSAPSKPAAPSRSSSASTRGKPVIAKPKFVGRRSQAARAELEKEAARKKAAESKAAAAEAGKKRWEHKGDGRGGARGGRGGRGRGGFMGDHQSRTQDGVASGPFGSGQVSSDSSSRRYAASTGGSGFGGGGFGGGGAGTSFGGSRSGGSGGGSGGSGVKYEAGSSGPHVFKTEGSVYISSDEDETEGRKKNIDDLQRVVDLTIEDDQQDDNVFAPVRLKREPHKDRTVAFNAETRPATGQSTSKDASATQGTSDRRKGKQRASDVVITQVRSKRPTAYSSSDDDGDEVPIKTETLDEEASARPVTPPTAPMTTEQPPASPPSSPESRRKAKEQIKSSDENPDEEDDDDEYPLPEMPKFQTQAEADEWRRHHADLDIIRKELGRQVLSAVGEDGSAAPTDTAAHQRAKKAEEIRSEHVYLFQFPPALPDLVPVRVKPDPDAVEVNSDEMQIDPPSQQPAIKKEEGYSNATKSLKPSLPSGSVGKLRIHKSGKAVLDWGGTSLVLSAGTDPSFLQNILIATVPETKPDADAPAEDQEEAIGMSMGQVRGKFVVTPNWDEILH